jgi:hypothetical protein
MGILVDLGTVFVEVLLAFYFFSKMFSGQRYRVWKQVVYYFIYGILLTIGTLLINIVPLRLTLLICMSLIGNYLCYSPKFAKNIYSTALLYISVIISDVLAGGIVNLFGDTVGLALDPTTQFVYNSIGKLINLVLLQLVLTFLQRESYPTPVVRLAIPLVLAQIASAYICYQNFFVLLRGGSAVTVVIETVCILYINVVACVFIEYLNQFYVSRERAAAAEHQLSAQQIYYQDTIVRQEETRALWHDIKKYFSAMELLVKTGKTSELHQINEEVRKQFQHLEQSVDVGNPILNGILEYALEQATLNACVLEMDVWVDADLPISTSDLYVMIGNTVDNAVEACANLPENNRKIHLVLRQRNHLLYYEISNPYVQSKEQSTKPIHGYGLRNVEKCVKNNGGEMDLREDGHYFTVRVQLNIP